jgi:RNA polymerase sigma-70 factor (ECF subfamily)
LAVTSPELTPPTEFYAALATLAPGSLFSAMAGLQETIARGNWQAIQKLRGSVCESVPIKRECPQNRIITEWSAIRNLTHYFSASLRNFDWAAIFCRRRCPRQRTAVLLASNLSQIEYTNLTTAKKILANGISEQEAIDRAKQGDAECFEALYGLHKRRVYSLCLRMVGNTAEAEDLTQEAFLQLYRKIATFRGESAFSTWLHRLSVNVVLMHLRKKGLPEVSLEETLEPQNEDGPRKDIGARDNVLAGSIDRVNLERSIESLPPGYRIIFVLHDVEGYEHNEIAEMMGCSIGNSKSQLHKARMKLRDLLKLSQAERAARR